MMRLVLTVFLMFCMGWMLPSFSVQAKPLIADMSDYRIAITSDFKGRRMLLFGARNQAGDVIITIRGPKRDVLMHKKEQFGGVWLNGQKVIFRDIPYFYAVNGTVELEDISHSTLTQQLQLGYGQLDFKTAHPVGNLRKQEFMEAFTARQENKRLYQHYQTPITFMGDTLFKTVMRFPDTLPRGKYAVDIYLVEEGIIRAMQTLPLEVKKLGFDAFVYDAAHKTPWIYGFFAIAIAIGFGWLVGYIFTKVW